jgi:hypothetical protein
MIARAPTLTLNDQAQQIAREIRNGDRGHTLSNAKHTIALLQWKQAQKDRQRAIDAIMAKWRGR